MQDQSERGYVDTYSGSCSVTEIGVGLISRLCLTMTRIKLEKIELDRLVPHERFREERVREVLNWFKKEGFQLRPIVVHMLENNEREGYLVLDGHHRIEVAKRLDLKYIMANVIDYLNPRIVVKPWEDGPRVSKKDILRTALNGETLPPKSTRHMIKEDENTVPFQDNDTIEPKIYTPLKALKKDS